MRSRSILSGVNVPIEPTSTVDSHVTNNVLIKNISCSELKAVEPTAALDSNNVTTVASYPDKDEENPYKEMTRDINEASTKADDDMNVDQYLIKLYQSILLSDNKKLLANVVSKNSIILTKEDLEKIISLKVGKTCVIEYEDPDMTCCGSTPLFLKIGVIKIQDNDGSAVSFKIVYNKDYQELTEQYKHFSMVY